MRAIKIDPYSKTITEIELKVNPNRSLSELRSIIGYDQLMLTPLDRGINLLSGEDDEAKPSFGFSLLDEPVIYGTAFVLGGTPHHLRTLHENKASFDMIVDWRENKKEFKNETTNNNRNCAQGRSSHPH